MCVRVCVCGGGGERETAREGVCACRTNPIYDKLHVACKYICI